MLVIQKWFDYWAVPMVTSPWLTHFLTSDIGVYALLWQVSLLLSSFQFLIREVQGSIIDQFFSILGKQQLGLNVSSFWTSRFRVQGFRFWLTWNQTNLIYSVMYLNIIRMPLCFVPAHLMDLWRTCLCELVETSLLKNIKYVKKQIN